MMEKVRWELQMFFLDSNNRKHKEVIKNVRRDISGEEVEEAMRLLVDLDRPQRNGIRNCTKAVSAKMVIKKEIVLFEAAPEPVPADGSVPISEKREDVTKKDEPKKRERKVKEPKTEITISEMGRMQPMKIVEVLKNDLAINGINDETIDRCITNALKTRALNSLLVVGKRIDSRIFAPMLQEITAQEEWSYQLVGQLDQLAPFFALPEWLTIVEKAQEAGRDQAARLFRSGRDWNYQKGDAYLQGLLAEAQASCADYREKERQLPQLLASLMAS